MEITEVRVKLVERSSERLRAFCSITLDGDFVIRDLKIIDGANGAFVAMPSRKLADRCPRCGCKNHLRARFCNDCGAKLNENRAPKDSQGRAKLHADVAHPINAACRERIQKAVVEAFEAELERAKSPDYKPPKFDDFDDYEDFSHEDVIEPVREPEPAASAAAEEPGDEKPEEPIEPASTSATEEDDGAFSDYNSLIAELKRDAENRRARREDSRPGGWQPRERREGNRPPREEGGASRQAGRPSEARSGGRPPRGEGGRGEPRHRRETPAHAAPPPPPPPRPARPAPAAPALDDFAADLDVPAAASSSQRPQRSSPPPRPSTPPPPPRPVRPVPPPPPPRPATEDDDFAAGIL